jgi:hypothetical protein
MTTMLLITMLLAGLGRPQSVASDPTTLEGRWAGFVDVKPGAMEVDFVVRFTELKADSGKGDLVFPTQSRAKHPLTFASAFANQVVFEIRDEKGIQTLFNGQLASAGSVEGEAFQQGEKHPFRMHRAEGEAWTRLDAQARLIELNGAAEGLRTRFNHDAGRVRLLLILSPSCGLCRMGARMTARYLLDVTDRKDLSVYVVWEMAGKEDTMAAAEEAAGMLADPRVSQFWSQDRVAGQAFKAAIGLTARPAASVYLAFGGDQEWGADTPPVPRFFMHSSPNSKELPQDRLYNGKVFGEEIRNLLEQGAATRNAIAARD